MNSNIAEPPPDNELIDYAIGAIETAERIGVSLTTSEVAIHFGLQPASRRQLINDTVRSKLPESIKGRGWMLTASEKVGRVAVAMHDNETRQLSASERFAQDKTFWERMGVVDAWQAHSFERSHYTQTRLNLLGQRPVAEMQWLKAADAGTFGKLQKMQQDGHILRFFEVSKTPLAVLDSANRIAEDTQKTFMHNWLPQYLHERLPPVITEKEQQRSYENDLGVIDAFRQRALRIEADDNLADEDRETIAKTNQLLADGLAGEYVLRHLMHDHAARESESLRRVLPLLAGLTIAAMGVQKYAPNDVIRAFAKVAGSGDDIALETMSLPQLKLSKERLRRRMRWFVPLAIAMIAADANVDKVDTLVSPHIGGLIYGMTTVGLSGFSSLGGLAENISRARQLIAEGKAPDEEVASPGKLARKHYIHNDPLRKGVIAGVIAGPVICAALWPMISDKPYLYVPLGAIEPIAATISVKYNERQLPRRLRQYTRQQIAALSDYHARGTE